MKVVIVFKCIHCGQESVHEGDDTDIIKNFQERRKKEAPCKKAKAHMFKVHNVTTSD